ncbi:hormogonium polysaccharide secretion pseudopilin HpsB [aff. Roholtiella sp. LEGE 12411]|uniref:hormogonium polysaccharide secretion pseudopilin HpsB n=1 Tax=aff. Roholtiella sp. LEGE 12411 TaxID=1828822 RepID=UPI00187E410F|nr:hormogonium polysaccharide secretion pseudopilin HpsB [aff. Roholtiella sp. LEGE 12411]MBE9037707.1 type II secretion system protein [aff. Roholtiella sp. LEGE 12411]
MIKRKQQQISCPSGESGFTIIESLVALLVVAILLTAIAPVIVLATATRVQSRRVELATQAAKTFIDGVRTGAIEAPSEVITGSLEPPTEDIPRTLADNLINSTDKMPAPTALTKTNLYCFNKNGQFTPPPDCISDLFYIQASRINVTTTETEAKKLAEIGYRLGIRVYRADADFPLTASTADTKNTQTPFTGGLGSRKAPLVEMTTDIASTNTSFQALCQRLGIATNKSCQ